MAQKFFIVVHCSGVGCGTRPLDEFSVYDVHETVRQVGRELYSWFLLIHIGRVWRVRM